MAKLRHIAISVPDPEKSAQFYEAAFGLKRVGTTDSPLATGVYLSDGVVNVALLKYKTDEAAGQERGKGYVGVHHFGFQVDDLEATRRRLQQHGAAFFMDVPEQRRTIYYEEKFRDPDGIIFDISHQGWVGTSE
jgi:catechol 2,3-dioxygenase-like lactoylglutathione lyase family enzyme